MNFSMEALLANRVAIITGAASGIGRASARLFARHGASVVLADLNAEDGEGSMADIRALVDAATTHFGGLHVIYSNAGFTRPGNAVETREEDWDRTIDVCLKATYMLAHCGVPAMLASGGGAFVVTASVHSIRGYARSTAYQAAKGGLTALTRTMAADFAPRIRVNAILPGAVQTGRPGSLTQEQIDQMAQMCVLRRIGQPEDIAQAALFLASDMSSYMTGESLVVDGGLTSIIQLPPGL